MGDFTRLLVLSFPALGQIYRECLPLPHILVKFRAVIGGWPLLVAALLSGTASTVGPLPFLQ